MKVDCLTGSKNRKGTDDAKSVVVKLFVFLHNQIDEIQILRKI